MLDGSLPCKGGGMWLLTDQVRLGLVVCVSVGRYVGRFIRPKRTNRPLIDEH